MGADLKIGSVLGGDFRVVELLGVGGMGSVYAAEQISTGKRRALKVMNRELVPDARSRARFIEEAKVGARIESAHVVEVIAAGVDETSGEPWIAMELLEGADLEEHVTRRGPLPPKDVLALFEQLGHALGEAHAIGIIHRDLKPENLFLAESRAVGAKPLLKVLDFGIATFVASDKTAATVTSAIGSPLWVAPEQMSTGAKIRPATDVWALGLIAFYLLTGKSYWPAANAEPFNLNALIAEILTHPLVPASERAKELWRGVPAGFDEWFARCVAREPMERFADASEAVAALRLLDGRRGASSRAPARSVARTAALGQAASPPVAAFSGRAAAQQPPGARDPGGRTQTSSAQPDMVFSRITVAVVAVVATLACGIVYLVVHANDAPAPIEAREESPEAAALEELLGVEEARAEEARAEEARAEEARAEERRGPIGTETPADVSSVPPGAERTPSGLASRVLAQGFGQRRPGPTDRVTVHYSGWRAEDGALFDSSTARGEPATFALDRVISGWTEGLQLMVEGEQRRFWIPGHLAYEGRPGPQGLLVFDVELLSFTSPTPAPPVPSDVSAPPSDALRTSSGLASRVIQAGTGTRHPGPTDRVRVHYTGWRAEDGEMFDSSITRGQPAEFPLDRVIPGWTEGVGLMVEGEQRRLWIPADLAYAGRPGAPQGMLVFDVELLAIL